ncbi:MAG: DUF1559 domain-containing protein [Planctomycetales bacterium]|nr:DUF1559 domain-containing protein [Planctomycetales bacterium]
MFRKSFGLEFQPMQGNSLRVSDWSKRRGNVAGFTIVELIAVTAIATVLLGLVVPAVQSARETARRTECQNHLRQLILAIHAHEGTFRVFPVPAVERESWQERILPFLEQPKPIRSANGKLSGSPENLSVFACPADPWSLGSVTKYVGTSYYINNGDGPAAANGFFDTGDHTPIAVGDVVDGLANTAAISERRAVPDTALAGQRFEDESIWRHRVIRTTRKLIEDPELFADECENRSAAPTVSQYVVPNYNHIQTPNRNSCTNGHLSDARASQYAAIAASSLHPGLVHLATVDGAVRPISDSIDRKLWRAIGTRNGGETTGDF